jgi:hypothetical protein
MSEYTCPICNKIFNRYIHYDKHLSRRKSCLKPLIYEYENDSDLELIENIINDNNIHKCKYCNKNYNRRDSLMRHLKTTVCKEKKEHDEKNIFNSNQNKTQNETYPINNQLINIIVEKSKIIEELKNKIDSNQNTENLELSNNNIIKEPEPSTLILNDIVIIAREEDNYVNATQLCLAGNKKFNNWYRMDSTKELIKELEISEEENSKKAKTRIRVLENSKKAETGISVLENCETRIRVSQNPDQISDISKNLHNFNIENDDLHNNEILIPIVNSKNPDMGIPISQNSQNSDEKNYKTKFIQINKGNSSKFIQGTWIHPDLAIQLAQWISPKFALQVSKWIRSLIVNGSVSLNETYLNELKLKEIEIKLKDKKIKLLQDSFLKKQPRKIYPEKYIIYMLTTEDNKKKRIYIIGKSTNLRQRLSGYNKTSEHEVVYYRNCNNEEDMKLIETLVLTKLKIYIEKANRDRFILPLDKDITFFTNIIDDCIKYITPV